MTTSKGGTSSVIFVLITVLIDTMGFGIVLPVLPTLIEELTGEGLSGASEFGGWLGASYALTQFIFAPIVGNLSDRFGRRPVLFASLAAFGVDYALMGFAPNITWLFIGRIIAGVAGAAYTSANAYIADVTPPEKRAQNFGLIGGAFGVGFILGPALGGLLGEFGPRAPFFAAAGLALLNLTYGVLIGLPESLPPESRRPFSWRRANTLGTLRQLSKYPVVMALAMTVFVWTFAHFVLPSTWAFYTEFKFNWSEREVGFSLAFAGVLMFLVQALLTRVLIPKMGERNAALLGMVIGGLGYLGYGLATETWMMYVMMALASLSGLTFPSLNALMSQQIPANAQGELQGGLSSLNGIAAVISPIVMTQLFAYFTAEGARIVLPGAPFLFAAVLVLCCLGLLLRALRLGALNHPAEPAAQPVIE